MRPANIRGPLQGGADARGATQRVPVAREIGVNKDSCSIHIRVHRADEEAVRSAFRIEPSERRNVVTGAGDVCELVFEGAEISWPSQQLIQQQITFDGRHSAGRHYSGQFFASQGGEHCFVDHTSDIISAPIDLDTLQVQPDALQRIREYKLLSQRVQQEFDREPPLELAPAAFHLEEDGDRKPWHRLRGSISIAGVPFHVEAIAVEPSAAEDGPQEAVAGDLRPSYEGATFRSGAGFHTVDLPTASGPDRPYVLFIYPYDR
jgi:hypothetical protein